MNELEFAERLKQYRKARGLTQQELADLLGVSNKSVSRWESGSYPDVATLAPLARALGVTVDDLLNCQAPVRMLERSDWQNLLSFAFAIGGGVLYFLLVLFTPVPVAYLLYLGAMAYGVYLQKHYTYHSKWFRWANLTMNFFVNASIVTKLLSLLGLAAFTGLSQLLAALPGVLANSYYGGVQILLACVIYLGLCVGATALTDYLIRRQVGGQLPPLRLTVERAPMTRRKWVPVGLAGLIALFWWLYLPTGDAVLPYFFYTNQQGWYTVLLLLCAAVCVVTFNWRGHRSMLLPSLGFVGACTFLSGCLSWDCVYNERNHLVYRSTSLAGSTYRFGQPTWGVWLLLAVFLACYLLCCRLRVKKGGAPTA